MNFTHSQCTARYTLDGCLIGNAEFDSGELSFYHETAELIVSSDQPSTATSPLLLTFESLLHFRVLKQRQLMKLETAMAPVESWANANGFTVRDGKDESRGSSVSTVVLLVRVATLQEMMHFLTEVAPSIAASRRGRSLSRISVTEPLPLSFAMPSPGKEAHSAKPMDASQGKGSKENAAMEINAPRESSSSAETVDSQEVQIHADQNHRSKSPSSSSSSSPVEVERKGEATKLTPRGTAAQPASTNKEAQETLDAQLETLCVTPFVINEPLRRSGKLNLTGDPVIGKKRHDGRDTENEDTPNPSSLTSSPERRNASESPVNGVSPAKKRKRTTSDEPPRLAKEERNRKQLTAGDSTVVIVEGCDSIEKQKNNKKAKKAPTTTPPKRKRQQKTTIGAVDSVLMALVQGNSSTRKRTGTELSAIASKTKESSIFSLPRKTTTTTTKNNNNNTTRSNTSAPAITDAEESHSRLMMETNTMKRDDRRGQRDNDDDENDGEAATGERSTLDVSNGGAFQQETHQRVSAHEMKVGYNFADMLTRPESADQIDAPAPGEGSTDGREEQSEFVSMYYGHCGTATSSRVPVSDTIVVADAAPISFSSVASKKTRKAKSNVKKLNGEQTQQSVELNTLTPVIADDQCKDVEPAGKVDGLELPVSKPDGKAADQASNPLNPQCAPRHAVSDITPPPPLHTTRENADENQCVSAEIINTKVGSIPMDRDFTIFQSTKDVNAPLASRFTFIYDLLNTFSLCARRMREVESEIRAEILLLEAATVAKAPKGP